MTLPESEGGQSPEECETQVDLTTLERTLKRAAEQTTVGTVPVSVLETITAVKVAKVRNWTKVLARFLRSSVCGSATLNTWKRPNKRYGFQSAATQTGKGKRLVIGVDTSGSMAKEEIEACLGECHAMLRASVQAEVMFFDTMVHDTVRLTKHTGITKCGRGGTAVTDFLTKACKRNADGIVVFTDGDISEQTLDTRLVQTQILWVLTDGDRDSGVVSKYGTKIVMDK